MQFSNDFINTIQPHSAKAVSDQYKIICEKECEKSKEKTETLRQHNELINALNKISENGGNIIIGDNATGIQIQQNSPNASQDLNNISEFNYEKVLDILNEIKNCTGSEQFYQAFDSKSEHIKEIIDLTIKLTEKKGDEALIKQSLKLLKELAIGAIGSVIGSGIVSLLSTLPI